MNQAAPTSRVALVLVGALPTRVVTAGLSYAENYSLLTAIRGTHPVVAAVVGGHQNMTVPELGGMELRARS